MHCTSCSCIWALVRYHICTCNLYATTGYTWHSLKRGGFMITFSPSACLSCCPSHADIKPTRPAIARYDGCSPELCPCGQSIYLPAWTRLQVGESITMQKWNSLQGGQVHHTDTAVRWWTLWVVFSSSCISALKYVVIIWFAINILWTLNIIMMMKPWASLVNGSIQIFGNNPQPNDLFLRERSFLGSQKTLIPAAYVTRMFVNKLWISFGVLFVLKCSFCHSFLFVVVDICLLTVFI